MNLLKTQSKIQAFERCMYYMLLTVGFFLSFQTQNHAQILCDSLTPFFEDGVSGLLVPAGDADALGKTILKLLADESLRVQIGKSGIERYHQVTDLEHVAKESLAIYERIASGHHR